MISRTDPMIPQTNYDDYKRVTSTEPLVSDTFTRTNRVLGIGCELNF